MNTSERSNTFLQAILEGFVDGILVLTDEKKLVYANTTANRLCKRLTMHPTESLPREVLQVCTALIDSREFCEEMPVVVETEVEQDATTLRIGAQWLTLEETHSPCLLVRLQDQNRSQQGLAVTEAQQWGLTPRETEVWLRRRAGWCRKAIATELYISLDTVKKHLKNIQVKRQMWVDEEAWQTSQAS